MTLEQIRVRYGVPAFKGNKIRVTESSGKVIEATIIGCAQGRLKIQNDCTGEIRLCDPVWNIDYLVINPHRPELNHIIEEPKKETL